MTKKGKIGKMFQGVWHFFRK